MMSENKKAFSFEFQSFASAQLETLGDVADP